jgi:hypothetical protein
MGVVDGIDICIQLGRENRFGNAGNPEWKVLHHKSLVCYMWVKLGYPLEELVYMHVHDDHETWIGDIPGPVGGFSSDLDAQLHELKAQIDCKVWQDLGIPEPTDDCRKRIKFVDMMAVMIEAVLFGPGCESCVDQLTGEQKRPYKDALLKVFPHRRFLIERI